MTDPGVAVRTARPADAFDAHYPRLLHPSRGALLLVAEDGGAVVGYALAHRLLVLFANGAVCEPQELMVEPSHRGRGVGRLLVEALTRCAAADGAVEVTVPTRRARDFYVRLGFEETATYLKRPLI